jgi:acyl dehydratase
MPLNYDAVRSISETATATYTVRDTMLYALGVGVGQDDPLSPAAMKYTYEDGLEALPTMACVLAAGDGGWMRDPANRITFAKVLHGEQRLTLHRPLPASGRVKGVFSVDAIYDKGADKGAILYMTNHLSDAATGEPIADVGMAAFLRADGGFGGSAEGAPKPPPVPADRSPDLTLDLPTRPDQALLYRLSGDYNPLHVDPRMAHAVGFERPILHGLCAYGVVGRALLRLLCGDDPARLRRLDVRFSSPLYPGETIRTEVWREGDGRAVFRALSVERGVVIQNNGLAEYSN